MPRFRVHDPNRVPLSDRLNAAAIVVCRLDSSRLPGKVLKSVGGRPLLQWVLQRLRHVKSLDRGVIVATSYRPVDDPLAEFCQQLDIPVFRGAAEDVAGRVLNCALEYQLDWFARVNADSPLVDPELLESALQIAATERFDFVTNLSPRSYPYGISTEVIRTSMFASACSAMHTAAHREHVTQILYQPDCPVIYRQYNLLNPDGDQSAVRLTVDTPADWQAFRELAEATDVNVSYRAAIQPTKPSRKAA